MSESSESKRKKYNGSQNDDSIEVIETSPDANVRRSPRKRSGNFEKIMKSLRSPESHNDGTRSLRNKQTTKNPSAKENLFNNVMNDLEKQLDEIAVNFFKSTELFDTSDVDGEKIYGFQSPVKKDAMVQKAQHSKSVVNTPKPKASSKVPAPVSTSKKKQAGSFKKDLTKRKLSLNESSESESVSEDSEYNPSGSENESEDDDDDEEDVVQSDDEEEEISKGKTKTEMKKPLVPITPCRRGRSRNAIQYRDYHLKTDEYFESQSEKAVTSNHTLKRLKNPRLDEAKLQKLLSNQSHISKVHQKAICNLTENYKTMFPMWYHIMEEGFSLLLHGLGSKRNLINDFYKEVVADHPTIIVNGFFPSLTIKDILDSIITELLEMDCPANPNDSFNLIRDTMEENPDSRLYLLIHNIDGVMLRSSKTQDVLSRLSAISNVHLLASVDHINAPLIWDNVQRSRYNFYWWDATTLLPYEAETSYESSLLVQQTGALALSSLNNVFASLTTNAKAIYNILLKYQIDNEKNNNYSGMAFKDLYRSAREDFLVSSDIALRAQLTEFIDHKLVRNKRNIDGAEYLIIPLDNSLLKKFLDEQS